MGQLFVYFLSADFSYLFTFCQLIQYRVESQIEKKTFGQKSCFFGHFFATTDASTLCLLLSAVLFTFSAICLQSQLFVYFLSADYLHFQLFVYIFSCLFTFLSAEISCLFTSCQLIFEFLRQNHVFLVTFLPLQMLQHFN